MRLFVCTVLASSLLASSPVPIQAQTSPAAPAVAVSPETRAAVSQLVGSVLVDGKAYEYDCQLADGIGPRLTGSANYNRAVTWAADTFRSLGLQNVHTEPFTLPASWEPDGPASGRILEPREQQLHIYSAGWSPSTPEGSIKGSVVYLSKMLPLSGLDAQKDKIAGSIVLYDNQSFGEGAALPDMLKAMGRLNEMHPKAILIAGGANGTQVADSITFGGTLANEPVAQIGREDELLIRRMLEKGPVTVEFSFKNRIRKNVEANNVVAEIPGTDDAPGAPSSIVILGAHLDSWNPGTGAQDNGTGVSMVLDVARAIQSLHRAPRRTVRFVLFGGEEEGLVGSAAYTKRHLAEMPSIDAVLVSDTGSQPAKGWYLMGREDEKDALTHIDSLLTGLGSAGTTSNTEFMFETDHAGFDVNGVPSLVLWNETDRYFKLHHQASDTFDSVVPSELAQGTATTAATVYAIADAPTPFAPHLTPDQTTEMLKKASQYGSYTYFKSIGWVP